MRALVVTVAGMSSRFSASLGREALKCVYYDRDQSRTLLGRLLGQTRGLFDEVVVVGGFRIDELKHYMAECLPRDVRERITLVANDHFFDRASGWSLHVGLSALPHGCDEIVFVEGDLFVDDASMRVLASGSGDAVTISTDPVLADRSVALYLDTLGRPRYAYDEGHGELQIGEPFLGVWSSGQAWRFGDPGRLLDASTAFARVGGMGTNLDIINPYFDGCDPSSVEMIEFREWFNCNTVEDWRRAFARRKVEDGD